MGFGCQLTNWISAMNRRETLTLAAGSILSLSGCSGAAGLLGDSSPVEVVSKNVTVDSTSCLPQEDVEQRATVRLVETDRLELAGQIEAERPCDRLYLDSKSGTGRRDVSDQAILLDVDPAYHGDCEPCPAAVSYTGTVTFDRTPAAVYLYHVAKKGTQWKRVGPVATAGDA